MGSSRTFNPDGASLNERWQHPGGRALRLRRVPARTRAGAARRRRRVRLPAGRGRRGGRAPEKRGTQPAGGDRRRGPSDAHLTLHGMALGGGSVVPHRAGVGGAHRTPARALRPTPSGEWGTRSTMSSATARRGFVRIEPGFATPPELLSPCATHFLELARPRAPRGGSIRARWSSCGRWAVRPASAHPGVRDAAVPVAGGRPGHSVRRTRSSRRGGGAIANWALEGDDGRVETEAAAAGLAAMPGDRPDAAAVDIDLRRAGDGRARRGRRVTRAGRVRSVWAVASRVVELRQARGGEPRRRSP